MHVSAHWAAFNALYGGGTVVLTRGSFDPSECWDLVEAEGVNLVVLVGNAMAGPLVEHLADHVRSTGSLFILASGGALLSPSMKVRIGELLPNVIVVDGFGSTETGVAGTSAGSAPAGEAPSFRMDDTTMVVDDEFRPVEPGSGVIGRLARRGRIPIGYYGDTEKTAATFVEHDGVRWVLPGDMASVAEDGAIIVHGRGSVSINTGGEKVFPEEVESVLVAHDAVADALVVGVPDDQWGQRVVAVVQLQSGADLDLGALQAHARTQLAGYKVPRDLIVVEQVPRGPNGKPDYAAARDRATDGH
jgi:acyl-CoA synthetase (AMP-forming)/AMP-acid ligase II